MKRILISITVVAAMLVSACESYDDSALNERIDQIESEVNSLKQQCQAVNDDAQALHTAIEAVAAAKYVKSVENLENGFKINFTDGTSATVTNGLKGDKGDKGDTGNDGADAVAPVVGVKAENDGVFYWTVNGEYLLSSGSKVPVQGGAAITPKFKVEDGQWYLSTDAGSTWTPVEGGKAGSNIKVTEDTDNVYLKLDDETTIALPKATQQAFKLQLSQTGSATIVAGSTIELTYTVDRADESTVVVAEADGYAAKVIATDYQSGKLQITAPATLPEAGYVMLKAVKNSTGEFSAQLVSFELGVITIVNNVVSFTEDGGTADVKVNTNVELKVNIPAEASWLTVVETKAIHEETVTFAAEVNTGAERTAVVTIEAADGSVAAQTVTFVQAAATVATEVSVEAALGKVFWSDATVSWTDVEGVESYEILVNGEKVGEAAAGVQTYKITGLDSGKSYTAKVAVNTKHYKGVSNDLDFTTGAFYQYKHNVGATHICVAFDNLTGSTAEASRGVKVQVSTTPDESGLVFDQYVFDGSLTGKQTAYGVTSYFGHTEGGSNQAISSRASVGNLKPGTTYYVRVKVAESYTLSSPYSGAGKTVTVTSPAGESAWSNWLECKTEQHVADAKEVLYMGFDAFCFNTDYVNMSPGTYPFVEDFVFNGKDNDVLFNDHVVSWPWTGEWRFASNGAIKTHGWGLTDYGNFLDGQAEHTAGAATIKNLVGTDASGDFKGWYISDDWCPAMGCIMIRSTVADGGHYVCSPAISSSNLSTTPTPCTLTFKECYITTGQPTKNKEGNTILVEVWHGDGSSELIETVVMDEGIFHGQKVDKKSYLLDYAFTEHSVDLNLRNGDAVCIKMGPAGRCAIDDICVKVK